VTINIPASSGYCPGTGGDKLNFNFTNQTVWPLLDHREMGPGPLWYPFLPSFPSNMPHCRTPIFNDPCFITYIWPSTYAFLQSIDFHWVANYTIGNRWVVPFAGCGLGIRLWNAGCGTFVCTPFPALAATPDSASGGFNYTHGSCLAACTTILLQGNGGGPIAFWTWAPRQVANTHNYIYGVSSGPPPDTPPSLTPGDGVDCPLVYLCVDNYLAFGGEEGDPTINICLCLCITEWREKIETKAIVLGVGLYENIAFPLNYTIFNITLKGIIPNHGHSAHPITSGVPHFPDAVDLEEAALLFNKVGVAEEKVRLELPLPAGRRSYEGVIKQIAIITPPGANYQEFTMQFQCAWNASVPQLRGWNNE
jgi:hypothetical protein